MKKDNKNDRHPLLVRIVVRIIKIFYKERKIIGMENIPDEPVIIVGNHAQLHGPLYSQIYFDKPKRIWCIGEMMHLKEVPAYAYKDFWSLKPKWIRWFYKILSYVIAPVASYAMGNVDTIAVYKDARIISTFKDTVKYMEQGKHIILFPECPTLYNEIINEFQDKFVDVARLYYKKTNKEVMFVPMYNAATLKTVVFGKPIKFDINKNMDVQRKEICDFLKSEITLLAKSLPQHKVVPYLNIKKKNYPMSK